MDESETLRLIDRLGDVGERVSVCAALARHLGAEAAFVFVPDPARPRKLIPAPGCRTVPSMRGWQSLLARCDEPGAVCGMVAFPDAATERTACAYAYPGLVVVLVGPEAFDAAADAQLRRLSSLLGGMLRAEAAVVAARGELEVERRNAERIAGLARALDRARADAEHATRVKDEFLAMLGHELRNPLAPIVTGLQMLRMQGVRARALDVVDRQVDHLMRLVDDLLDISRITSGKVELRREPVEIAAVVQRALELSRPLLEQRRSQVTVEVPAEGLMVDGDPARLAQIVSNLVTNAAKYSPAGSAIQISAALVDGQADRVELRVVDHGIGIEAAYLERVFEQFVQVPQGIERSAGGLGLGLAIVRSLVEQHGGTVRAASLGRGHGSTFSVELPRLPADAPLAAPAPMVVPAARPSRTMRLLIVDDNADAAAVLGELLASYGHDVEVAHSGPDALAHVDAFTPDAALLDIGLPVMDGYELAHALRGRFPDVKLVALTGYGQAEDRERSRTAGFHAHLVKPVSISKITDTLEGLMS